jgi:hypothetical protein
MRSSAFFLACLVSCSLACGSSPPGSACKNPIGVSEAAPPDTVQHFANQRVGRVVRFDVPSNTASITIVEQAVNAPDTITYQPAGQAATVLANTAVPYEVLDPSGARIYDDNTPVSSLSPDAIANLTAFFATSAPATGTLTIPNTSGGLRLVTSGLTPGTWQLTVSDYAYECSFKQPKGVTCSGGSDGSTYDVTVVTKPLAPGGGIPASGALDIVVYFATTIATHEGLAPLSAATANAGKDADLNRMEQTLGSLLLQGAGITVRSVTYVDLPAELQAKYAKEIDVDQTGGCSPIADLFRYGADGKTLNIFFVSSFIAAGLQAGNDVVGLDGTIPGPATIGGSAGSGAAVATHDLRQTGKCPTGAPDYVNCGPDTTAYIIAHEAGHFLGLYHVTEVDGTQFDPLLDTPMCPCAACASSPGTCAQSASSSSSNSYPMTVDDCTRTALNADGTLKCGGGDNLMFWRLESGSRGTLSAEQQQVIRANPLVQ